MANEKNRIGDPQISASVDEPQTETDINSNVTRAENEYEAIQEALTFRQKRPDPNTGQPIQEPGWILPSLESKASKSKPLIEVFVKSSTL